MSELTLHRICITPYVSGIGGMVSFRQKMTLGLEEQGIEVTNLLEDLPYQSILVIGGTRDLPGLWRAKRAGIPIIQRLDGMNWLHKKIKTSLRHYLRSEYGNLLLNLIRTRFASSIVYQSTFSKNWWESVYGNTIIPNKVILNGVDTNIYSPEGPHQRPGTYYRVLLVEGNLDGGYEIGLENSVKLSEILQTNFRVQVELMVAGKVTSKTQRIWEEQAKVSIKWLGTVSPEKIPEIDRSAHIFYSADINPACPNAVIESLACGLPVVAFDTGALPELVPPLAGAIVPYGGNPWELEKPDLTSLANSAFEVLLSGEKNRKEARNWALEKFDLKKMVNAYLEPLSTK